MASTVSTDTRFARLGSKSGVGVAEVLVALVIFSTALLGIVGTAARVGGIVNSSHVRLKAGVLARQQIEELMAMPYDSVKAGSSTIDRIDCSWTVTVTPRAKEITLVYRYEMKNGTRADTLSTAVLRP